MPYEMEGWVGDFGKQSVVGTNLAVQEINERDDILADYEISVIYKNSMVSFFLVNEFRIYLKGKRSRGPI